MKIIIIRCFTLLLALTGLLTTGTVMAKDWYYTVRDTDSLWSICSTYVERRLCFIELGDYNKLPKRNLISPGSVIKIPYAWLKNPPEPALVVYSRGEVAYLPAAVAAELPREKVSLSLGITGMAAAGVVLQSLPSDSRIYMGDRIVTGAGNVRVEFGDGSQMIIRPQSDVLFDRLSIRGDKGFVDTLLILKRGATTNMVEPREGRGSRFRIKTPAGVAAVRGTEFRVGLDKDNTGVLRSEVLEGSVAVADLKGASEKAVNEGFGVRKEAGKPVPLPRKLLPAPAWQGDPAMALGVPFSVGWEALPGAVYYLVDLYDGDGLLETRQADAAQLEFTELPDGVYRLIARGVDEVGLQGLEAERSLQVVTPLPVPALTPASITPVSGKTLQIDWPVIDAAESYLVEIARDPGFTNIIATRQTDSASITHKSGRPIFLRVTAIYPDGSQSDASNFVEWRPDSDYLALVMGTLSILFALLVL